MFVIKADNDHPYYYATPYWILNIRFSPLVFKTTLCKTEI